MTGGGFKFGPFDEANSLVYDGEILATTANCGPAWPQTFTFFEAFGNLTKSGNSSFNAGYSPSTNHMTNPGSPTPTYDNYGGYTYRPVWLGYLDLDALGAHLYHRPVALGAAAR